MSPPEARFSEAWHAQAVAVVELLVAQGRIAASDWAATLGAELDRRAAGPAPDDEATYYEAYLAALELILDRAGLAGGPEVARRAEDWRQAYLSTPHGKPVVLGGQDGTA